MGWFSSIVAIFSKPKEDEPISPNLQSGHDCVCVDNCLECTDEYIIVTNHDDDVYRYGFAEVQMKKVQEIQEIQKKEVQNDKLNNKRKINNLITGNNLSKKQLKKRQRKMDKKEKRMQMKNLNNVKLNHNYKCAKNREKKHINKK
jgi:hypothetical protein